MTRRHNVPMATGTTTPLRIAVADRRGWPGRLTIKITAGQVGGSKRTTLWTWETEASTWWHFGSLLIDEAICMSVEGVVATEWPRRLDALLKEIFRGDEAGLAHPPPNR